VLVVFGVKMQQINGINVDKLPRNAYYVSKEDIRKNFYENEPHIHKQGPLSGIKASAHKLTNDIVTYFPKGFKGSKNSDFYEFLSLGMVPYLIGSAMLIALNKGCNKLFKFTDKIAADKNGNKMAAGVVLYGFGKLLHQKLAHSAIHASTGVNLDMLYLNKVNELPEDGMEKGLVRVQYPGVFSSVDFYRKDLLAKDGELNYNNVYEYDDKIAKKAGYKEKLNDSTQTMDPKIRELKARTTALSNIGKYIVAATGVALGAQKSFEDPFKLLNEDLSSLKLTKVPVLKLLKNIGSTFVEAGKTLWKGTNRNLLTKHGGKALILASIIATINTWLIPTKGFKTNPNTMKSTVDTNKEFEVC